MNNPRVQLIVYYPNNLIVSSVASIAGAAQMKSANVTLVPFTISKDPRSASIGRKNIVT
jgi:hypothetical protein